jgi:hypothetical protein
MAAIEQWLPDIGHEQIALVVGRHTPCPASCACSNDVDMN